VRFKRRSRREQENSKLAGSWKGYKYPAFTATRVTCWIWPWRFWIVAEDPGRRGSGVTDRPEKASGFSFVFESHIGVFEIEDAVAPVAPQFSRSVKRALSIMLLSTFAIFAKAADPDIPNSFFPPPNDAVRRAFQKPISGNFNAEPVSQVFGSLFRQLPANFVFSSHKPVEPRFTGKFDDIPFRTAIFLVAKATACKIEWTTRPDGARLISIHD